MKIFVMVDMEGISGICRTTQVSLDGKDYPAGRRYMTWDVNACVEGCFRGGATEVLVRDAHSGGFNLIWEDLDPRAEYLQGSLPERMPGIDGCDGLILLGYHAMAGVPGAVLEHTWSSAHWQNLWINGEKSGELRLDAAMAGDHGVPPIMVSGDDKLCAEARELVNGAVAVEVKRGMSLDGGRLLPKARAHELITEGAERAVRAGRSIPPYKVPGPVTIRLELVSRGRLPVKRKDVRILDGRTYEVTGPSVEEAFNLL
ncbi:MAG: M55 family metallopeptidase [Candidatus Sumerlaeota bacterium]|nr:M55 family metallopeptidase [Candidatus Sumerlaeota bacterium]